MIDCSVITDQMTWSYSRIKAFKQCKYGFLLSYIYEYEKKQNFFSQYGSFVHKILEMYFNGELNKDELSIYYVMNFNDCVTERAPSKKIYSNYFASGLNYFSDFNNFADIGKIIGVEKKFECDISGKPFIGFIDVIVENDDGYVIVDHKSKNLKARSKKSKPTKTDIELDDYLTQLYLYSVWTEQEYKKPPSLLGFNIFRGNREIFEPFDKGKQEAAIKWVKDSIDEINKERNWSPNIDYYFCNNLCDMREHCEYFKMFK